MIKRALSLYRNVRMGVTCYAHTLLALIMMLLLTAPAFAQSATSTAVPQTNPDGSSVLAGGVATNVWVTTQDFVALRAGPSRGFAQVTTVPADLTLPAYGRTSDTSWVQVEYQGQRGWIDARYLVWSGDVISLPVDGVNPAPFIRRAATLGTVTRDTPAYVKWQDPTQTVITIPKGVTLELTGRIGDDQGDYYDNYFRVQVRYQGNLYWVASYDLMIVDGDYHRLLDLAYLFPYGRLYLAFQDNLALAIGSFNQIDDIWQRLSAGIYVACSPIPPLVKQTVTPADATSVQTFIPAVTALQSATNDINGAITAFSSACSNPSFTLTSDYIATQTGALDDAYNNLLLSGSLLDPLRANNPLLQGIHSNDSDDSDSS